MKSRPYHIRKAAEYLNRAEYWHTLASRNFNENVERSTKTTAKGTDIYYKLSGVDSTLFTPIIKQLNSAREQVKTLKKIENKANERLLELINKEPFNIADKFNTRFIQTASCVITVSQETVRRSEKVDLKGLAAKLVELTGKTVEEMDKLINDYTSITETAVKSSIRNIKVSENTTNPANFIIRWVRNIYGKATNILKNFDNNFAKILKQYGVSQG